MDYKDDKDVNLEERWLKMSAFATANEILGNPERKHQAWFGEDDMELNALLDARSEAKVKALQRRTRSNIDRLAKARSKLQKCTREKKSTEE